MNVSQIHVLMETAAILLMVIHVVAIPVLQDNTATMVRFKMIKI